MRTNGRARVSTRSPVAFAVCDRCGLRYNRNRLNWQFEYAGLELTNLRVLVCRICLDVPQPQLRTVILTPDPLPVRDPRPDNSVMTTGYVQYMTDDFGNIVGDEQGHVIVVGTGAPDPANFGLLSDDVGNLVTDGDGNDVNISG